MLTTLGFCSLYYKLPICLYVMHITPHLHVVKDFWNFLILKNISNSKKFQIPHLLNCEFSLNVGNRLLSSNYFTIKIILLK
jgi:hypothetical protein